MDAQAAQALDLGHDADELQGIARGARAVGSDGRFGGKDEAKPGLRRVDVVQRECGRLAGARHVVPFQLPERCFFCALSTTSCSRRWIHERLTLRHPVDYVSAT